MAKLAVVKAAGKQYLVRGNDVIIVDKIASSEKTINLETLAVFNEDGTSVEVGRPTLLPSKAEIIEQGKGEKIRISRFKAKVRFRRLKGFRPQLTKLKITSI